jgi:geranylgeranyl diphosphate synthase type I
MSVSNFFTELENTEKAVTEFIFDNLNSSIPIQPGILDTCTRSYIIKSGKKLRPTVLLLSCMAVGGNREAAIAAAAAVELFHTWTLVHDDIIDNDNLRRGGETVHITAKRHAQEQLGLDEAKAAKYGIDIAILTGDIQHGWATSILANTLPKKGIKAEVILHLIDLLQTKVLRTLVEGEVMDVEMGLNSDFLTVSDEKIVEMLWKKTGVLYEFCGIAGGLIGKNQLEYDEEIIALQHFCSLCGTAFQIQDDILGLVGKEAELGKPVGSDIREGKKTLLVTEAIRNANEMQRATILESLGNRQADSQSIDRATTLIIELGGVKKAQIMAQDYIRRASVYLDQIKPSYSKDMLGAWASYLIERKF